MGIVTSIRQWKNLARTSPARRGCTSLIYLVRAGDRWSSGESGAVTGLSEIGFIQMQDLAKQIAVNHPPEVIRVFSVGGTARRKNSADIMADTLGTSAVHLDDSVLSSELRFGFGELARSLRLAAEEGMEVGIIVVAEPLIRSFLGLPTGSVEEASAHSFCLYSPSRIAIPSIKIP